ncbi:MAG: pilus assembly protein [Alphaproteobacteria bacterium]|nr:pilus assembly protein [Alphaproteobacteria bacterium]
MWNRLVKRWRERLRRFDASERGAAAVEFALLAPPFLLILGVIMETGLMMFTEYTLQSAVQDSSRLVRTGQAQSTPLSAAQFKTKICGTAGVIIDCSNKVTVYVRSDANFATLKTNLPNFLTIGGAVGTTPAGPNCYNPGQPSQPAAVVATYDWYFNMWGMSFLGNIAGNTARRLVGFAIFQNEPYPSAGATAC